MNSLYSNPGYQNQPHWQNYASPGQGQQDYSKMPWFCLPPPQPPAPQPYDCYQPSAQQYTHSCPPPQGHCNPGQPIYGAPQPPLFSQPPAYIQPPMHYQPPIPYFSHAPVYLAPSQPEHDLSTLLLSNMINLMTILLTLFSHLLNSQAVPESHQQAVSQEPAMADAKFTIAKEPVTEKPAPEPYPLKQPISPTAGQTASQTVTQTSTNVQASNNDTSTQIVNQTNTSIQSYSGNTQTNGTDSLAKDIISSVQATVDSALSTAKATILSSLEKLKTA